MRKLLIGMLATGVFLGEAAPAAHAICGQSFASFADQDLFNVHGCDAEFIEATKKEASLSRGDWIGRGWDGGNSCNIFYEFPKFWNSWYLVTYGISPIPAPLPCPPGQIICFDGRERPWHDEYDYQSLVRADNLGDILIYHKDLNYEPSDTRAFYGVYWRRDVGSGVGVLDAGISDLGELFGVDMGPTIKLGCDAFDKRPDSDPPALGATPGYRSSTMVHEAWHGWNHVWEKLVRADGASGHEVNGPEFCASRPNACASCTQPACDHFRPHTHSAYQSGQLWQAGQGTRFPISVYQLNLEHACDLSDNAQTWVPYSVREDAANSAGWLAENRFVEKVPYWCGSTRPLWGMRPRGNPEWCADQSRKSCHGGCPSGDVCGNDGCCIKQCPAGTTCQCPSGATCSADYTCVGTNYSCDQATGCCYYNVIN